MEKEREEIEFKGFGVSCLGFKIDGFRFYLTRDRQALDARS